LCLFSQARADVTAEWAYALSTRYAPYADWATVLDLEAHLPQAGPAYWRTAAAIRAERTPKQAALSGLHLALDPGHIGGEWAEEEGRHFRINEADFAVREGELVLEVAQRVRDQLTALGAEVTLLRETTEPVNPNGPDAYLKAAKAQFAAPATTEPEALREHRSVIEDRATRLSIVTGDILERARLVNEVIQPDALISLHINAAPWPKPAQAVDAASADTPQSQQRSPELRLVRANHLHVLVFGCVAEDELKLQRHQARLLHKLSNGSGVEEFYLGGALGQALGEATGLAPAQYDGKNAIRLDSGDPYLWARNLIILRLVDCPTVLLEPYVANSEPAYGRIQQALAQRAAGAAPADDDILVEYADAVVAGILTRYGSAPLK